MSGPANVMRFGYVWEGWMNDYIKKYCTKDGLALDIGAHIGVHTIEMAKYAKCVLAFEPNPETYQILQLNTKNINNVRTYNVGVGDHNGDATLIMKDINTLSQLKEEYSQDVKIAIISLDNFLKEDKEQISFVKIDIEGFEINAFQGMKVLLTKYKPVIVFEDHTGDTCKYLESEHAYKVHRINKGNFLALNHE
jgi:FkbM family methyltransferase